MSGVLRKREPILADHLIYYKIEGEDHAKCVRVLTTQERTLNQLSWIHGERHGYKWMRVQRQVGDTTEEFYINLNTLNGLQNITVTDRDDLHDDIAAKYEAAQPEDQVRLISTNPGNNVRHMTLAEAEELMKKAGSVEYMQDVNILNKTPKKREDLDINLELLGREVHFSRSSVLIEVPFFGDMEVKGLFRQQPALDRTKFFETDNALRKINEEIKTSDTMSLGRLLTLIFNIYTYYHWFIKMANTDRQAQNGATDASIYCWSAAQFCLENIQTLASAFRIKMVMQDSGMRAVVPQCGTNELVFDMSLERVPIVYAMDEFPNIVPALEEVNIMPDFQKHGPYNSMENIEEILWGKIEEAKVRSSGNGEIFDDADRIAATMELSKKVGSGRKYNRRSEYFNLVDDFPIAREDTSTVEENHVPVLSETKVFRFMRILAGGENADKDISKCITFNTVKDDVLTSTRLSRRSTIAGDYFPNRSRSTSRNKLAPVRLNEPGEDVSVSGNTTKVQFAPVRTSSDAREPTVNDTMTAQSVLTVTHLAPEGLPRTSLLNSCSPDFTAEENALMGVLESDNEVDKLSRRSRYLKSNALYDEDHQITTITDQIRKKMEESQVHYDQTPAKIQGWKANDIKEFARGYGNMQGFVKSLREESKKLEEVINKNVQEGKISDTCWKLGKYAMETADGECSRLLRLIRTNNEQLDDRNISKGEKEIKISVLKDLVGTFSGEELNKSVNARTFLQFKDALEENLQHHQVDKKDWGYYAKFLLDGDAKQTYDREMYGESNPNYEKLMGHIQKYHGKASDVLRAVTSRQLLLEDITSATSARKKQQICRDHRACFDQIKRVLEHSSENVGAVRQHLVKVLLKLPEHLIENIRMALDDETVDLKQVIERCHKLCDYIHNLARDQIHAGGYDGLNQSYAAVAPINPATIKQDTRQARQNSTRPKVFSTKEIEPRDCPMCSHVQRLGIRPFATSKTHVVTSNGTVVMDACPNLRELDTTNKAMRATAAKLCRRCGKETVGANHSESSCGMKIKTIQCKDDKCELLAAFCDRHKHMNTAIHEAKKKRMDALGLAYNFHSQPILEGEEEMLNQCFLTSHQPAYTHSSVRDMIKSQDPSVMVNNKQGRPIFPIGLMDSMNGGVVPYVFDSGSSLTSILVGSDGIAFPTAPVDDGEEEWSRVIGVGGPTEVRFVYILVPLVCGKLAKIKAQVIENTLRCQTRNLDRLTRILADEAKAAGVMEPAEEIQYPEYGSRSALMLGLSHQHLAPQPIYQANNGLVLYQGCLAGPMTHELSNGVKRTLCIGGSLLDKSCEEKYSNLWMSISDKDVDKPVIVEGSEARAGEWGTQWQDLSETLDDEAMLSLSKDQDRANSIVHGPYRINQSAAELSRDVSSLIAEAEECSLTGGEIPNSMMLRRRDALQENQKFLLQHGLEER